MVPAILGVFGSLIDKIFPNADDAQKARIELLKMQESGELAQLEVNKAEASNSHIFVSGWRPFIGWVCGIIFLYNYLIQPAITLAATYHTQHVFPALPILDSTDVMTVLFGMLGLGSLRTVEKIKGVHNT